MRAIILAAGEASRWGRYAAARTPEDIAWIRDRVPA